jgi:hypothetical protein
LYRFTLFFLLFISLHASQKYELGKGISLGKTPIYVGGYFSLNYEKSEEEESYSLDDLAFLSYARFEKISYLLELEYKELYSTLYTDEQTIHSSNTKLYTERAYIKYDYNQNYSLRLGKFNSPIGFWNVVPINIFRETTSTPKSNAILFPKFTTGIDIEYHSYAKGELALHLLVQNNDDIDTEYNNYHLKKHYGIGIAYDLQNYRVQFNSGFFQTQESNEKLSYFLLSLKYESDYFELLAEVGKQFSSTTPTPHKGSYIQGSYHITQKHSAIIRLESYKALQESEDLFSVFAYKYSPLEPVALKIEYQLHSDDDLNKILCSFSVLF